MVYRTQSSQLNLQQMPKDLHKVPISESCQILCVCRKASHDSKQNVSSCSVSFSTMQVIGQTFSTAKE